MPPSPAELRALLIEMLAGATDTKPARWERCLGQVEQVSLTLSPASNWRIAAPATGADAEPAAHAIEILREAHPYVRW